MVILYNANHQQMHLTAIKSVLSRPHIKQKHPLILTRQQSPIFLFQHLLYKTPVFKKNLPKTNVPSLN